MSTPGVLPTNPQTATPRLSEGERVINTFFAPSKTFADIRVNKSWLVPLVLFSIMAIAFTFTVSKKIGYDQVVQNEIAKSSKADQIERMPAADRDRILNTQAKVSEYFGYGAPILVVLFAAITAGILLAIFNFGLGTQVDFKTAMAIVMYGWLPTVVSTLLAIVSMFAGVSPEGFNIRNPVATNPAYFMNPLENKFLYGVLTGVDIIAIWCAFLMAVGFSQNSKVKLGTAFTTILVAYFLFKIAGAGFALMF